MKELVERHGQCSRGCLVRQERQRVRWDKARWQPPRSGTQLPTAVLVSMSCRSAERWQWTQAKLKENSQVLQKQWFSFWVLLELHFRNKPTVVCVQVPKRRKNMFQMLVEWIEFVYKCHLEIIDLHSLSVHWLCVVKYELVPIDYNLVEDQLWIVWPAVITKGATLPINMPGKPFLQELMKNSKLSFPKRDSVKIQSHYSRGLWFFTGSFQNHTAFCNTWSCCHVEEFLKPDRNINQV